MLRFASGDIVRVNTGPCRGWGFTGARVSVVGRSDDLLIVKGAKIYPGAIKKVINEFTPDLTGELRIVLDTPPPTGTPPLRMRVEVVEHVTDEDLPGLEERAKSALHHKVRVTLVIERGLGRRAAARPGQDPLLEKNY